MKICSKECKHFMSVKNTDECGSGICSYTDFYSPVNLEEDCKFQPKDYTCNDCVHFGDFACFTADKDDKPCVGFIDIKEDAIYNTVYTWRLRGISSTEISDKIQKIITEVDNSFKEL